MMSYGIAGLGTDEKKAQIAACAVLRAKAAYGGPGAGAESGSGTDIPIVPIAVVAGIVGYLVWMKRKKG